MFFLDEDESRYVIRGLAPRARQEGIAEELRGWRWDSAPLAPLYEAALTVEDIADQHCPTGRDVYLRHVLGVEPERDEGARLEQSVQEALCAIVAETKRAIYEHGPLALEFMPVTQPPAVEWPNDAVRQPSEGVSAAVRLLWGFEQRRIAARIEAALARQPGIARDALAAAAVPVTVGRRLDGRYLGLAGQVAIDAVGFPEPVVFAVRVGEPSPWDRLRPAGHALLLEGLHETPFNLGAITYIALADGRLSITRDLFVIDDEVRQAFVDGRDERARLVEEEIDPGLPPVCPERCPMLAHCRG